MSFKKNIANSNITFCIKNPTIKYKFQLHQDSKPIEIKTIEKVTVTCHQGDYIMTGVVDEQWVVNQKKFKTTYTPIIENTIKAEALANSDSKIKPINLNKDNQNGKLLLPWGENGAKKEVEFTKEDVLIYDEKEKYWYPCKKSVFASTYLINESKIELEKQFKDLLKLTTKKNTNSQLHNLNSNNQKQLNVSEINDCLSPPLLLTAINNKSLQ